VLIVNAVNPTAGLLAGDRIACSVSVESGASLSLTTPSASRVHRMDAGFAEVSQNLRVAARGFLDCWPEQLIPQAGSRLRQSTHISVEEGGALLFLESIAPGRVASGEAFEFAEIEWRTDIFSSHAHIVRERYRLTPSCEAVRVLRSIFDHAYHATCFVIAPQLSATSPCWARFFAMHGPEVWIGSTPLGHAGWAIKVIANGSIAMRRTLSAVRSELYASLGRSEPSFRRLATIEKTPGK
jgi:urease accessory protein